MSIINNSANDWLSNNTFLSLDYEDIDKISFMKKESGMSVSVCLPALNEQENIGEIISRIKMTLNENPGIYDEIVLIDGGSEDKTREIASSLGISVYQQKETLPKYGISSGKGDALWKSLYILNGDIIIWIDCDTKKFHPRFVYNLLWVMLNNRELVFCKGFFRRFHHLEKTSVELPGGRVTELSARPLLNIFYPELSGFFQPLAGECAILRSAAESIPFFSEYGVEVGILIDLLNKFGLNSLAQVNLGSRFQKGQDLSSLSKMSFSIMHVMLKRLRQNNRLNWVDELSSYMRTVDYKSDIVVASVLEHLTEYEHQAMQDIPEYQEKFSI